MYGKTVKNCFYMYMERVDSLTLAPHSVNRGTLLEIGWKE